MKEELSIDTWAGRDRLDRGPLVDELARLVANLRAPQVLAIEGDWGSGKTHVVRMLQERLSSMGHACIYFDAWANDGAADPLVPLLATIDEQFDSLRPTTSSEKAWKVAKSAGVVLAATAAPIVAGAAVQLAVGAAIAHTASKVAGELIKKTDDVAEKAVEALIAQHKREAAARTEFRGMLAEFSSSWGSADERGKKQVFVFVDELDRCRPPFAVSLLERAKHAFGTPGVQFIIGVDRKQLEVSVKGEYGQLTDSAAYLRRLIDVWFRLPSPKVSAFVDYLFERFDLKGALNGRNPAILDQASSVISLLGELYHIPLRSLEQAVHHLDIALRLQAPGKTLRLNLLSFYSVMRILRPHEIRRYAEGEGGIDGILQAVRAEVLDLQPLSSYWWINLEGTLRALSADEQDRSTLEERSAKTRDGIFGRERAMLELDWAVKGRVAQVRQSGDAIGQWEREFAWRQIELTANFTRFVEV